MEIGSKMQIGGWGRVAMVACLEAAATGGKKPGQKRTTMKKLVLLLTYDLLPRLFTPL